MSQEIVVERHRTVPKASPLEIQLDHSLVLTGSHILQQRNLNDLAADCSS